MKQSEKAVPKSSSRGMIVAGFETAWQDQPQTSCSMDGYTVHAPETPIYYVCSINDTS
jgi:hypothetical protein